MRATLSAPDTRSAHVRASRQVAEYIYDTYILSIISPFRISFENSTASPIVDRSFSLSIARRRTSDFHELLNVDVLLKLSEYFRPVCVSPDYENVRVIVKLSTTTTAACTNRWISEEFAIDSVSWNF